MNKNIVLFLLLTSAGVKAEVETSDTLPEFSKYSYFMLGSEFVRYQESYSKYDSDVSVSNIVVMSGGLTRVNDRIDFSLDTVSTLLPNEGNETWTAANDLDFTVQTCANPDLTAAACESQNLYEERTVSVGANTVLQKNRVKIGNSSLRGLFHFKWTPVWRTVAGAKFSYESYKRYGARTDFPDVVSVTTSEVEESVANLNVNVGMAYESAPDSQDRSHSVARFVIGMPVWRQAENTSFPNSTFDEASGYEIDLEGRHLWSVYSGVELGIYAGYQYTSRDEERLVDAGGGGKDLILPDATTEAFRLGAMASWDL